MDGGYKTTIIASHMTTDLANARLQRSRYRTHTHARTHTFSIRHLISFVTSAVTPHTVPSATRLVVHAVALDKCIHTAQRGCSDRDPEKGGEREREKRAASRTNWVTTVAFRAFRKPNIAHCRARNTHTHVVTRRYTTTKAHPRGPWF